MSHPLSLLRRQKLFVPLFLTAVMLGVALGGALLGVSLRPNGEQKSGGGETRGLLFEPSALDFGTVCEDNTFRWVVLVTNSGESRVRVVRFSSTCSCSRISPEAFEIAAGETREVTLTLDLRPTNTQEAAQATRPISVEIAPISRDGEDEYRGPASEVVGVVKRSLRPSTPFIDLGRHSELSGRVVAKTLIVDAVNDIDDFSVTAPPPFRAEVARSKGDPDRYAVSLHTRERLRIGNVRGDVVLKPFRKGVALPTHTIALRGEVVDDVEIPPPTVLFGTHPVGTTLRETVSLRSLTGAAVDVVKTEAVGSGTSVTRTGDGYVVEMRIDSAGGHEGTVVFSLRRGDGQVRTREISLSCLGIGR